MTDALRRIVGRYDRGLDGPTLLVCGGLHGNEPAGVAAAERVAARLEADRPELRGAFLAVAGNLGALRAGRRFLAVDLNRSWMPERVQSLLGADPGPDAGEDAEQRALLGVLEEAAARARGPLVLLDLHTTSGESPPFAVVSDALRNRPLAFALGIPVLLGLEESVDGTLLHWATERRHVALVVEAGRHDDPRSVDRLEAVTWIALAACGALDVPGLGAHRELLARACAGLPRVVELVHVHPVARGDGFRMEEGFRGFQPVRRGELLGRDARGEVRAPAGGRVLMPLYQEQGSEGFYVVRPVRRFWLRLSGLLRRLRLHVLLPLLPGVRKHPDRPHALLVDPRIARFLALDVFHLFGYRRRRRPEDGRLVFVRRR